MITERREREAARAPADARSRAMPPPRRRPDARRAPAVHFNRRAAGGWENRATHCGFTAATKRRPEGALSDWVQPDRSAYIPYALPWPAECVMHRRCRDAALGVNARPRQGIAMRWATISLALRCALAPATRGRRACIQPSRARSRRHVPSTTLRWFIAQVPIGLHHAGQSAHSQ